MRVLTAAALAALTLVSLGACSDASQGDPPARTPSSSTPAAGPTQPAPTYPPRCLGDKPDSRTSANRIAFGTATTIGTRAGELRVAAGVPRFMGYPEGWGGIPRGMDAIEIKLVVNPTDKVARLERGSFVLIDRSGNACQYATGDGTLDDIGRGLDVDDSQVVTLRFWRPRDTILKDLQLTYLEPGTGTPQVTWF